MVDVSTAVTTRTSEEEVKRTLKGVRHGMDPLEEREGALVEVLVDPLGNQVLPPAPPDEPPPPDPDDDEPDVLVDDLDDPLGLAVEQPGIRLDRRIQQSELASVDEMMGRAEEARPDLGPIETEAPALGLLFARNADADRARTADPRATGFAASLARMPRAQHLYAVREAVRLRTGGLDAQPSANVGASPAMATKIAVQGDVGGLAGPSIHDLAAAGVASGGGRLPFFDRIQSAFGRYDVSGIKVSTGGNARAAAEAMGAKAYATGERIAFASSPDLHTAAHEAAHVIQQRAGVTLPGGVGREGDTYERHADAVADLVVQGRSAEHLLARFGPKVGFSAPASAGDIQGYGGAVQFGGGGASTLPTSGDEEQKDTGPSMPTKVIVDLAGFPIVINLPTTSGSQAGTGGDKTAVPSWKRRHDAAYYKDVNRIRKARGLPLIEPKEPANPSAAAKAAAVSFTVVLELEPVPGLRLQSATVTLDAQGNFASGRIDGSLLLGGFLAADIQLGIDADRVVSTDIPGIAFQLGDLISGSANLRVTPDGMMGSAKVGFENLNLPEPLTLDSGSVEFAIDSAGSFSGTGAVSGLLEPLGRYSLDVDISDTSLQGLLRFDLTNHIEIIPGVYVEYGTLEGAYTRESSQLRGTVGFGIKTLAKGEVSAIYDLYTGQWGITSGRVEQIDPLVFEGITLSNGVLVVDVEATTITGVTAEIDYETPLLRGHLKGSYVLEGDLFSGDATAELIEPLPLGETGVTLDAFSGMAKVENNALVEVTGQAEATIPWAGEPTFKVVAQGCKLLPQENKLSGEVTVSMLRDLAFGSEGGARAVLTTESSATATMVDNQLVQIQSGIVVRVEDAVGEIGVGSVQLTIVDGLADGEATFTLSNDIGFPERENPQAYFVAGSTVVCEIAKNQPTRLRFEPVTFAVENPAGAGKFQGEFTGAYDLVGNSIDGTGTATVAETWPLEADWGNLSFVEGGSITATVAHSAVTQLAGAITFDAVIEAQEQRFHIEGTIEGSFDREKNLVNGTATATLLNNVGLMIGPEGNIRILEGTTIGAQVLDNKLENLTMALKAEFYHQGEHYFNGQFQGTYDRTTGFTGSGSAELVHEIDLAEWSDYRMALLPSTGIAMEVVENDPRTMNGAIETGLFKADTQVLQASVSGKFEFETKNFNGTGSAKVVNDWVFDDFAWGEFAFLQGGEITGTVTDSTLKGIEGTIPFGARSAAEPVVTLLGSVAGKWDAETNMVDGIATAQLAENLVLPTGTGELRILKDSSVEAAVSQNQLDTLTLNMSAEYDHDGVHLLDGTFGGTYKPDAGFDGSGSITLVNAYTVGETNGFILSLEPGTTGEATIVASEVTHLAGTLNFAIAKAEGTIITGTVQGDYTVATNILNAEGTGQIVAPWRETFDWGTLDFTSGNAKFSIVESALTYVEGALGVDADIQGEPRIVLRGAFEGSYDVPTRMANGKASAELVETIVSAVGTGELHMLAGSKVDATVTNNEFANFHVLAKGEYHLDGSAFAEGSFEGEWEKEAGFSGEGTATLLQAVEAGTVGEYKALITEGAGATATFEKSSLVRVSGQVPFGIEYAGTRIIEGAAEGTYEVEPSLFSGKGAAQIIAPWVIQVPGGVLTFFAGNAEVVVTENALISVSGGIDFLAALETLGINLQGHIDGAYDGATSLVSGSASALLIDDVVMPVDAGELRMLAGSEMSATVAASEFADFHVKMLGAYDHEGTRFVEGSFEGDWAKETGFSGTGSATVITAIDAAEVGEYTLRIIEGAGASVTFAASAITKVTGSIPMALDEGEERFLKGALTGEYDFLAKNFSGSGSVEVVTERQLAEFEGQLLYLNPGSGASATVENNALQSIAGNLILGVRDGEGEYFIIKLAGTFDAAGGTGFTGQGGVQVTRDKCLFGSPGEGYSVWLVVGAGANAYIVENQLTKVDGDIPFMVSDGQPLLNGKVTGVFDPATGKLDGTGAVFLARDMDYGLGSSTIIKFKAGSGGSGEVKNGELRKLAGNLDVELWTDGSPLVGLKASGEYDAVENNLVYVDGQAKLLRPFELLDGAIIISDVAGSARVENNALVRAGGSGKIAIPALNNMTGTFALNWSNETGTDVYSGSGQLDFNLFEGKDGRGVSGSVAATYNEDGTFLVDGKVQYDINDQIGGKIGVQVDNSLDPVLSGSLAVNTQLIPGRDLFKLEKDLIPQITIPVYGPIALFFGLRGGMGLSMRPLMLSAAIGIENFRPLSQKSEMPDFNIPLDLKWGMDFGAMLGAYMSMGLSVGVASASAGIRGEVAVNAPLEVNPYGVLRGGKDGFAGELGVGVSIRPTLELRAIPFVEARITLFDPIKHDFEGFKKNLGVLFSVEWGTKYTFGDVQKKEDHPIEKKAAPPAQQSAKENKGVPTTGFGGGARAPSSPGWAPQVESPQKMAEQNAPSDGAQGQLGELMKKVDDIKVLAEGIGALGELVGLIVSLITATLTAGPIGFAVVAAWKIFTGELTWDGVKKAVDKVLKAVNKAQEMFRPYLPDWLNWVIDYFNGKKPGLLDGLFGADDKMREAVHKGDHKHAPPDMRAKMINEMMSGVCGDADEDCILEVLRFSKSKGDINKVISMVDGGVDELLWKLDGSQDDQLRELLDSCGIKY